MSFKCAKYCIVHKKAIAADTYSFTISCPDVANIAHAGQFVHVKVEGFTLRRPISICETDSETGSIRIVFEVRGAGTAKLAVLGENDCIDMLAPLGNGFSLPTVVTEGKRPVFVGGGIGVPPLLGAAKGFKAQALAILGFRSSEKVILAEDFKRAGVETLICTEDGSMGAKGLVTEPLAAEISAGNVGNVYACGPVPMLKAVAELCKNNGIACEVSLEQRMGCGTGACAVCTCIVQREGEKQYLRVCRDGPVFGGDEVVFE